MRPSSRFPKTANRFARDTFAASAVEFALVAPMFIAMVVFIIDTSLVYLLGANIDNSTWKAADSIRSGGPQLAGFTASQFKTQVLCPLLSDSIACSRVKVNVANRWGSNLWSVAPGTDYSVATEHWCPGAANVIQVFQVAVPLPTLSAIWAGALSSQTQYFYAGTFFQTDNFSSSYVGSPC